MSFLSYIFGTKATRSSHDADMDAMVGATSSMEATDLPTWRSDVADWEPPPRVPTPARTQAEALIALFQGEGRTGPVPHYELTASYAECAWVNGYVQLSEGKILRALGTLCDKVRRDVHVNGITWPRVIHYVVPVPHGVANVDNVVAMRRVRGTPPSPSTCSKPGKNYTRAKARRKRTASGPQAGAHFAAGKGAAFRAGIPGAAAYG